MLVDQQGHFLTQREFPLMAVLRMNQAPEGLQVFHPGRPSDTLQIPYHSPQNEPLQVQIWNDEVTAFRVNKEADAWFSQQLRTSCSLVFFGEGSDRQVNPQYAPSPTQTTFTDGYPYNILGEASLQDLNDRLEKPVGFERFRPNFTFAGGLPLGEDHWGKFRVGEALFERVKPCQRCSIPTINQTTGKAGKEPTATLAKYRARDHKVYFGQHLICHQGSKVNVGDEIVLL